MKKILLFVAFCALLTPSVQAQLKPISGPMLGYIEHREALIWLEVPSAVDVVAVRYRKKGKPETEKEAFGAMEFAYDYRTVKVVLENLDMNTEYEYDVYFNEERIVPSVPTIFKTKKLWEWREEAPDFSFLIGSCFYINDTPYDRPGKPYGQDPKILETMGDTPSDFMIWLGDNVYLREADYSSASGIAYRYSYNFATPQMQKLRATRANYAIWDDHDFGPNDSEGTYELKDFALETFRRYWGNKSYGEQDNPGVYSKFRWSDCDFFLVDDRYHRSPANLPDSVNGKPNPEKIILGEKQLKWLKNSLLTSNATFKFVVIGSQALNALGTEESFIHYPHEMQDLLRCITDNRISGVVFLSGDRHFTEMLTYKPSPKAYTIFEYTSSAVTSGVARPSAREKNNPQRTEGSLLTENNFGKLEVTGKKGDRKVTFKTIDGNGKERWTFTLSEKDLK